MSSWTWNGEGGVRRGLMRLYEPLSDGFETKD